MTRLRSLIDGPEPLLAPLALDGLMAKLAEQAGFRAIYLGGGGLGYAKTFLEANLNVTEMAQAGIELAAATSLPVILDGACGWGDPMHLTRTIALTEAAGFAAIELEDQVYPKRAHHHVGEDHAVARDVMEAKVRVAAQARRDRDFLIIARTGVATTDPDDALRRCEAYRHAGADVLIPVPGNLKDIDQIVAIGERLGPPLMFLAPPGGLAHVGLTVAELHAAGYRIIIDAMSLQLLVYEVLKAGYAQLAADGFTVAPERSLPQWWELLGELHESIGIDVLLEIERRT